MDIPEGHDPSAPIDLAATELAPYLAALVSGDAAAVREIELRNDIGRQGGAPWVGVDRRVWLCAPLWDHAGLTLLSGAAIGARIEGPAGPFKIETSAAGQPSLLDTFVQYFRNCL